VERQAEAAPTSAGLFERHDFERSLVVVADTGWTPRDWLLYVSRGTVARCTHELSPAHPFLALGCTALSVVRLSVGSPARLGDTGLVRLSVG
jgi:hypothetical protein